ncbi:MAG: GDSL-type esterase/lipase family protein [Candidatus Omnitrophica bacterium]|nr:GDSL-type esterase/lipase family protein [Candidatus Omnitrophota bacterium]
MIRNKTFGIGAVIMLAGILFCAGCMVRPGVANIDSPGTAVVCFGDSVTYGYGAEENGSYPAVLQSLTPVPVVNAGINGDTTREAVKRVDNDVLDRDPLLVVIEFGGNDLIARIPFEETIANVETMVQRCQAKGAMVAIADYSGPMILEDYNREFRSLSRKYQTIFIPRLMDGIIEKPSMRSDYIHPNANGYKLIAHRIFRAIMPYLTRNAFRRHKVK